MNPIQTAMLRALNMQAGAFARLLEAQAEALRSLAAALPSSARAIDSSAVPAPVRSAASETAFAPRSPEFSAHNH